MAPSAAIQIIAAQNERTTMRDMYRIASLLVAITYAQLRAMEWSVLERVVDTPGRPLLIVRHSCTMPMADEPLAECGSEEERRTFFSISGCVVAIAWNTGWLAHLVEGSDIELVELNFHGMKPVRKVMVREGSRITLVEAPKHTVLLLRSKVSGESLIADPTFAQYGFECGIETLADYREHKADMDCPVEVSLLGSATGVQAWNDNTLSSQAKTAITSFTAEKAIIDHIGDKEAFFNLDAAGFQRCQDDVAAIVYDKELEQRQELENALSDDYDEPDGKKPYGEALERRLNPYAERLLGLVDDCERV